MSHKFTVAVHYYKTIEPLWVKHSYIETAATLLSLEYGYPFEYIKWCTTEEREYIVTVDTPEEEILFFLKTGFRKTNSATVID